MKEKRSYKNPYHQTQSELAEWLALFAQDYSTTEVADALVERYPERSTGDSKADRRLAKEAICTINPNDSRYNAEKWAKQYGLMQANYATAREKHLRQLESKSVTALNAVFDNLESTISSLSPKEQISLVPKALLTLNQAVKNIKPPVSQAQLDNSEEDAEEQAKFATEVDEMINRIHREGKARDMLWEGKSFDEIREETGVDEDILKDDMARRRVEDEVIGMVNNYKKREEIQRETKLAYAYIDRLIDNRNVRRIYRFGYREEERQSNYERTRALSKNGNGADLEADSDATRR